MDEPKSSCVSVSRTIQAPPDVIFNVLADPKMHPVLDGSGMLRHATSDAVLTGIGDVFTMKMYLASLGDYEMRNVVVEFELDRRICWEPTPGDAVSAEAADLAIGTSQGYLWGFELTPEAPGATVVTELFDCSRASDYVRKAVNNGASWIASMTESLERLDEISVRVRTEAAG
jgi:hypothetical protein